LELFAYESLRYVAKCLAFPTDTILARFQRTFERPRANFTAIRQSVALVSAWIAFGLVIARFSSTFANFHKLLRLLSPL
jgi:hypothetical protein